MSGGQLVSVYLFGSLAREDGDDISDADVLAIVEDGRGTVSEAEVIEPISHFLREREPSISWYGKSRIRQMFENGELFAWHLHQEATFLDGREDFISKLGAPSQYEGAEDDVNSFAEIAADVEREIRTCPENYIYELGLIYVCLRNASMAASSALCGKAGFSRLSPYNLGNEVPTCPLSAEEYETAMRARMAGQRGIEPPNVTTDFAASAAKRASAWLKTLNETVQQANG